ncbi:MAG TPA: hypothetical protein DEA55_03490 [Rhodospirillaceae bacterium]|nr:hypothetical protein [Rhodospirillaceae bacterium]
MIDPDALKAFDENPDLNFLSWAHTRAARARPEVSERLDMLMNKGAEEDTLRRKNDAVKTLTMALNLAEKEGDEEDIIRVGALLEAVLDGDDRVFYIDLDNARPC